MKKFKKKKEKIVYSAPASLILTGEQGILYGKPMVGTALDMRVRCSVYPCDHPSYDQRTQTIITLIIHYLQQSKIRFVDRPFQYSFHSSIPQRGDCVFHAVSAELASLVSAVLYFFTHTEHTIDVVNNIVYEVEKKIISHPLGFSNTASCMGGVIYYRKEFAFLKGIYQLFVKIPPVIEDTLFIIDTGKREEGGQDMISEIGVFYQKNPRGAEILFNEMEKYTKRMVIAFMKEDVSFFQDTVVRSQNLLEQMGVVSEESKKNIKHLSLHAVSKVIGSGGIQKSSGFLLCSARDVRQFTQFLKKSNCVFYKLRQSVHGVRREFT